MDKTGKVHSVIGRFEYNGIARELKTPIGIAPAFNPKSKENRLPYKQYSGIWDTGATNSVITRRIVDECALKPIGMIRTQTAGGEMNSYVYYVNLLLMGRIEVISVKVSECVLPGADMLIGMDIIGLGDFSITNKAGKTDFAFRCPSEGWLDIDRLNLSSSDSKSKTPLGPTQPQARPRIYPDATRNQPCPCGSGKKHKKCCLDKPTNSSNSNP